MADHGDLVLSGVAVRYDRRTVLEGVSLTVSPGCLLGIVGPNGAGKSTLFRAILGRVPFSGTITVPGGDPAYVPQGSQAPLDLPLTARDVALMGRYTYRRWWQRLTREDRIAADMALDAVGMADHADCAFGTLSGGQRQRVLVARALAHDRPVILLDEPMTGVDPTSHQAIMQGIRSLRDDGRIVLMSTHDLNDAATQCDRIAIINRTIIGEGTPDAVLVPHVIRRAYADTAIILRDANGVPFGLLDDAHDHHDHHEHHYAPTTHDEHHHS